MAPRIVTIDLDDEDTRRKVAVAYAAGSRPDMWSALEVLLPLQEPTGIGAVVRDRTGDVFVRIERVPGMPWVVAAVKDGGDYAWCEIASPVKFSDGVVTWTG